MSAVARREPMPGSVYKSKKFEAAVSKLRKKKAALLSPDKPRNLPKRTEARISQADESANISSKSQPDQRPATPPSPCGSCATSCSCEDHSAGSQINDTTRNSNNSNQNTPVAGVRPSVRVSDARRRKGEIPAGLVKRVKREEERKSDPRHGDRSVRQDRDRDRGERLRIECERRHLEHPNDDRDQKHGVHPERGERREKRHRRQEKTSRLLRKDYPSLLKYFLKDSIYFVMKSSNYENIQISMDRGVWSTPPQNEHKLSKAYHNHRNVILIFSAKESGRFAGLARLSSDLIPDHPPIDWILPPSLAGKKIFSGVFQVDWISRRELPFLLTSHLFNPLNEGKPVKIARDGQEIDARIGSELVSLFPRDEEIQIIPLLKRMKKQTMNRIKKLDALEQQQRGPGDQSLPPGADGDRPVHHRLRVVLHNNLHSSSSDRRGGRRVHVPAPSARHRHQQQQPAPRPDVRDRLDFSRRVAPDHEVTSSLRGSFGSLRQRHRHPHD